jgi:Ca2+-binding RTX toxin-like protein
MATFNGTAADETIRPGFVTASVTSTPSGARPSNAADIINGGGGDDVIDSGGGDDIVFGGTGADDVLLGDGDDRYIMNTSQGTDSVNGGSGFDTFAIATLDDGLPSLFVTAVSTGTSLAGVAIVNDIERLELNGRDGSDYFSISASVADIAEIAVDYGGPAGGGPDASGDSTMVEGSASADTLILSLENGLVSVTGLRPSITVANWTRQDGISLFGHGGNDVLDATALPADALRVTLVGGDGRDTLKPGERAERLVGDFASSSQDYVDTVDYRASAGAVAVDLAAGTGLGGSAHGDELFAIDNLVGSAFADILVGGVGANALSGGAGDDQLYGGEGNDLLRGGGGADRSFGGMGSDRHVVDDAGDLVFEYEGEGNDVVVASAGYTLRDGAHVERLLAAAGDAAIHLTGNELPNSLFGNDGNNILTGRGGADRLTGGDGADRFRYASEAEAGIAGTRDTITDFQGAGMAGGDRIDLGLIDAVAGGADNAFAFIGSAAFTAAGQIRVAYDAAADVTIISGNTDGDLAAEFQIALPGDLRALTGTDFVL